MRIVLTLGLMFSGALGLTIANGSAAAPKPAPEPAPGDGVLCTAAILNVAAEVGRQCFPGKNKAVQAELEHSISLLDAFILRDPKTTKEQLAQFKLEQGGVGAPKEKLCHGDALMIYETIVSADPEILRSGTAKLVARPGKPAWGDCL